MESNDKMVTRDWIDIDREIKAFGDRHDMPYAYVASLVMIEQLDRISRQLEEAKEKGH